MYLTPKRIQRQLDRAEKLQRILWRLYSPYKEHRKLIVKASYKIIEIVEILEELYSLVKSDYNKEFNNIDTNTRIPPVYKESTNEEKE